MPVARADRQPSSDRRQQARVSRNDSLRSERSDKRVSFNKDVGIKTIPRGQKEQSQTLGRPKRDEWSQFAPVHLEKQSLSSEELERQAEDLVRLLDQVDCISAPKPIHHPAYTARSLERTNNKHNNKNKPNNAKPLNNNERKHNQFDGISKPSLPNNKNLSNSRTTNHIGLNHKDNINLYHNRNSNLENEVKRLPDRPLSAHRSTTDIYNSDHDYPHDSAYVTTYKSVPDIPTTIYYDNNNKNHKKYSYLVDHDVSESKNFMSVDNLHDDRGRKLTKPKSYKKTRNEYKSADNLTDISIPGNRKLHGYQPVENLQSGFSSTSDIKMLDTEGYRPKVGNMIKRFNSESEEHKVRNHIIYREGSTSPLGYREPDNLLSHSNSKPFSYTSAPLSSVEEIRRLSPSRDIPILKEETSYAQVNKSNRRVNRSTSREYDRNSRTTDSDYSAKIIITGNNVHSRYDDDDHAYETYQVGESPFARQMREYGMSADDIFDDYKNPSNNNFNMSSIGVQTEGLPKAPTRSRRNQQSRSPVRHESYNEADYEEDLPSASLVRRINHGFGRIDRSPSPPPVKAVSSRRLPRNVVPLLSDTDDSEFGYQRRMDPLAKIRNQVMIREKLQEEKEAEEREEKENEMFERNRKHLLELNTSEMQPLTIDEVDALTLEMDKRNSLVVAHENSSNNVSRVSNEYHRSRKSETNTNRVQSAPPRGRKATPEVPKEKERSLSPRIFSPFHTLEKKKNNIDKENKSTLEKNKGKEKKKKKIKIKFFYDPRPQDKTNEDPLNRFTEYKGTSSADEGSPKRVPQEEEHYDEYYNNRKTTTKYSNRNDYHSLPRDSYIEKEVSHHGMERNHSPHRDDSSPTRPPRSASRDRTRANKEERPRSARPGRESSSERTLTKDSRNNRINATIRSDYDSTIERRESKERRANKDRHRIDREKDNSFLERREQYERLDTDRRTQYNNIRNETTVDTKYTKVSKGDYEIQNGRDEIKPFRKNHNDYNESDHHDSSDQGPSLSGKYKNLARRASTPIEKTNTLRKNDDISAVIVNEDEERKEKIQRQRKKFLGVLLGEGRTKSSPSDPPSQPKILSSTLPRTTQTSKEPPTSNTLQRLPQEEVAPLSVNSSRADKKPSKRASPKKKRRRPWPWSLLGKKGASGRRGDKKPRDPNRSSRASSRASSRTSSRRPSVRATKIRKDVLEGRPYIVRDREADDREKQQWESATLSKSELRTRGKGRETPPPRVFGKTQRTTLEKQSGDSSASSTATPVRRTVRTSNSKQRYFGDTDTENGKPIRSITSVGSNYQSLPTRKSRTHGSKQNLNVRRAVNVRQASPGTRGSAGSSLQSSESEADSHGGSHASRASHVSTGSNRSVYLHATAVADIPVRRSSDEAPSEKGISKQSKKVSRSFSLVTPWKPRHYREKYEVEYDNREVREAREPKSERKSALPPRPPRKATESADIKKVGRSQTVYKDSKLAGWLRRKRNKEVKGI